MRFAANLSLLFPAEMSWAERCYRVAKQGFTDVEILFPYEQPIEQWQSWLQEHNLRPVLINTPIDSAPVGRAALAGQQQGFLTDIRQAITYCQALGAPAVHVMAGSCAQPDWLWQDNLVTQLEAALAQAKVMAPARSTPIRWQLEALNDKDVPHYAYHDPRALLPVLQHFRGQPVGLQFDFYHTLRQGYDLLDLLKTLHPHITHVQIADPHGRGAPDFERHSELLQGLYYLYEIGYQGSIGLEYRPAGRFEDSLGFLQALPADWQPHRQNR